MTHKARSSSDRALAARGAWRDPRRRCLLLLCLFVLAGSAVAQSPESQPTTQPVSSRPATLAPDAINARIRDLESNTTLPEDVRARAAAAYRDALIQLAQADESAARQLAILRQLEEMPAELGRLKAELSESGRATSEPASAPATLVELEAALAQADSRRDQAQETLRKADEAIKRRASLAIEGPTQLAGVRQELDKLQAAPTGPPSPDAPAEQTQAEATLLEARRFAGERKLAALEAELSFFQAAGELLTARYDKAARELTLAEQRSARLREAVTRRQGDEAQAAARQAEREAAAVQIDPVLKQLADANADLARRRAELAPQRDALVARQAEVKAQAEGIQREFEDVGKQVDAAEFSRVVGQLLRTLRSGLPDLRPHRREGRSRQTLLADAQFKAFEVQAKRRALGDIEPAVEAALASLPPETSAARRADFEQQVRKLLLTQKELLSALADDYVKLVSLLTSLDIAVSKLIEITQEYAQFIDERILWTRDSAPLGLVDLKNLPDAVRWLTGPANWLDVLSSQKRGLQSNPALAPVVMLALLLLLAKLPLARRLRALSLDAAKPRHLKYPDTLAALIYTALLAAPLPLLLVALALPLNGSPDPSEFARAVTAGLLRAAGTLAPLLVLMHVARIHGLGGSYFHWPHRALRVLRRNLVWLTPLAAVFMFVASVVDAQSSSAIRDSLGRLTLIVNALLRAVFLAIVLHPRRGVFFETTSANPKGWGHRLRWLWYVLGIAAPLGVAISAGAGYAYAGERLGARLWLTLLLCAAGIVLHALLQRWLLLQRRKLAIAQAEKRRLAAIEAAQRSAEGDSGVSATGRFVAAVGSPGDAVSDSEIDLVSIGSQTRRLLFSGVFVAVVVAVWLLWSSLLPALALLRNISLWENGATLADLVLAVVIAAITWVAVGNLPGLLEIALLQRLPLDSGSRYAITTVSRYVLTVVGTTATFNALGVHWSHVQWLIAAISVGLGFGLQEIFANFVSGLIILFERPVRLGDTVTIGDVSGTVSRIRIRSTTITDWDRKELIIPNKEFVTGQIVNWTLTDTLLRLVIPVGVSYGSDVERVRRTLLEVARRNRRVVDDPRPRVYFIALGDSTLDFELRVFVQDVDDWLIARDELLGAIVESFRAAGIEFAFPQRDVHLRVNQALPLMISQNLPAARAADRDAIVPADEGGQPADSGLDPARPLDRPRPPTPSRSG